jgi:excisionase family DNA binding protein
VSRTPTTLTDSQEPALLPAPDVARMLGVPTSWVYEQSRRDRIPTVTLGRCRRYRREAIDDWIREIENAGSTATARRAVG